MPASLPSGIGNSRTGEAGRHEARRRHVLDNPRPQGSHLP